MNLDGFHPIKYARPDINPRAIRPSGGMYIFIRNSILKGIEVLHNRKDLIAWFRFDKTFFGWNNDAYVASCYIAPPNSPHLDINAFGLIQDDIARLPYNSKQVLLLDGNAHTNICDDFISDIPGTDEGLNNLTGTHFNACSIPDAIKQRSSADLRPVDDHGRGLLNLCKSSNVFIANSRLPGNDYKKGAITWISRGNSEHIGVLDYILCSPNMYEEIESFNVGNFLPSSDHAPIELVLNCNIANSNKPVNKQIPNWESQYKFTWERNKLPEFSSSK